MLISVKTLSSEKMGEIHHVIKKLGVPFALTNLSLMYRQIHYNEQKANIVVKCMSHSTES